jgi:hypothetical protein
MFKCVRFFRATRGETAHEQIGKYLAASSPERVEGQAKRGFVTQDDATA